MNRKNEYPIIKADIIKKTASPPEVLLFDTNREIGYVVDGMAGQFCLLFDGTQSLGSLIAQFAKSHQISEQELEQGLSELVDSLEKNQILSWLTHPL